MPLVKKKRGDITEEWLKSQQFGRMEKNEYRLKVELPYEGKRFIEARLLDETWIVYYTVNGLRATTDIIFTREVSMLIDVLGASDIMPV